MGGPVEAIAVSVLPVARPDEWHAFAESILEEGERAEGHRAMLRRFGVTREHACFQPTPDGGVAVLVWEGIDQGSAAQALMEVLTKPQSEHERYVKEHVVPVIHGIDITNPPPSLQRIGTIEP
jgi:hypothetical protein